MKISYVILTWNSEYYIEKCLFSIIKAMDELSENYEIFTVDNGSIDNTPNILKNYQKNYPQHIIPIFLNTNRGTTFSRNIALKQVKGDVIAIIDSDIILPQGVLPKLITHLTTQKKTGMVVPKLVYGDGRFQKSTDNFPNVLSKLYRYLFLKNIESKQEITKRFPITVDYAISAFWLLKREVLGTVGLLDEKFFYAPEDVDYCLRIWKAGYKILYIPSVTVIHDAQEISRGFKINKALWEHIKGLCYFFWKHGYLFNAPKLS